METKTIADKSTRFDTRLPKEQKLYFEKAVQLGGYRNLTEFILSSAMEKASKIISDREQIIASQRDSEIFFDAVFNQGHPNDLLLEAVIEYKHQLT
jgi:uncharacterized protein (DUF1778 family)